LAKATRKELVSFAKREAEGGYGPKYVGFSAEGREGVLVAAVLDGCIDGARGC